MNKDADLSRNINKDSIIYQHEQSKGLTTMTNEQIGNEAASYVNDILGLDYIGEAEAERAFKAGASWRINSVWHTMYEMPKQGLTLCVNDNGCALICGPNYDESKIMQGN